MRLGTRLSGATLDHLHTVRRVTPVSGRTSSLVLHGLVLLLDQQHTKHVIAGVGDDVPRGRRARTRLSGGLLHFTLALVVFDGELTAA